MRQVNLFCAIQLAPIIMSVQQLTHVHKQNLQILTAMLLLTLSIEILTIALQALHIKLHVFLVIMVKSLLWDHKQYIKLNMLLDTIVFTIIQFYIVMKPTTIHPIIPTINTD